MTGEVMQSEEQRRSAGLVKEYGLGKGGLGKSMAPLSIE